jgi:hypothetical protein
MIMAPRKGSKRVTKVRPALDFNALTVAKVAPEQMSQYRPTRGERDPEQRQVDSIVKSAWDAWVAAGKPEAWDEQPGTYLSVPEAHAETLKWRVGRSGSFYDLRIRFGRTEIEERDDGKFAVVVFTAITKPSGEADTADTPS